MKTITNTIEREFGPAGERECYEVTYTAQFTVDGVFMGLTIDEVRKYRLAGDIFETLDSDDDERVLLDGVFEGWCFSHIETFCDMRLQLKETLLSELF